MTTPSPMQIAGARVYERTAAEIARDRQMRDAHARRSHWTAWAIMYAAALVGLAAALVIDAIWA